MTIQTPSQETTIHPHLYRLSNRDDCKLADEAPDVRGWNVFSTDGENVGTVRDIIVDPNALRIRYLLVEVTYDETSKEAFILIPIGLAEVDETWDRILLLGIKAWLIPHLPVFRGNKIKRDYEWALRRTLMQEDDEAEADTTDAFYDFPHFDDTKFMQRRRRFLRERTDTSVTEMHADAPAGEINTNPYLRRR